MKKSRKKTLKEKLWAITSELVRRREADDNGQVKCVTCGKFGHYKEFHAGHYIPKAQGNAVYFDLRNIHPQCPTCNTNGGSLINYKKFMIFKYGSDVIEVLQKLANTTWKMYDNDFAIMIEERTKLLKIEQQRMN